jgi:hypothetical protein
MMQLVLIDLNESYRADPGLATQSHAVIELALKFSAGITQ